MPIVAVLGASAKPDRYSYQAVALYASLGWTVYPVHPSGEAVAGQATAKRLEDLPGQPDVVCIYLNPQTALALVDAIVACRPRLVWLNPGADGPVIEAPLRARGLAVFSGCTLVALRVHGDPFSAAAS